MNKWKLEDPSEGELENQAVHFIFGVVKRQGAIAAVGNEDIVQEEKSVSKVQGKWVIIRTTEFQPESC